MGYKGTMSDNGIRNLDELREDDGRAMPRGVTVAFVVLGGACIGFAALALGGRSSPPQVPKADPLGELVSSRAAAAAPPASARPPVDLSSNDVTFPRLLSDEDQPTTALAVVRPMGARETATTAAPIKPPPATDRLPVVPLPAQSILEASPVVTRPRDSMTQQASDAAQFGSGVQLPNTGRGRGVCGSAPRTGPQGLRARGSGPRSGHVVPRARWAVSHATFGHAVSCDLRGEGARRAVRRAARDDRESALAACRGSRSIGRSIGRSRVARGAGARGSCAIACRGDPHGSARALAPENRGAHRAGASPRRQGRAKHGCREPPRVIGGARATGLRFALMV
jgi:hypothetical protein